MFGYITANYTELPKPLQQRYGAIYCGICRCIRSQSGSPARLGLRYDMAFLAALLMSLYEPEETAGKNACILHPVTRRAWVENGCIRYAADMNVALSYYKLLDDWQDDGSRGAKLLSDVYARYLPRIEETYPQQCADIRDCLARLRELEEANCPNPDEPANVFGQLMASLLTYRQDLWTEELGQMGLYLGRFIYLLDAALDYDRDKKQGSYNPFLAMGQEKNWEHWEDYLVQTMGRCTQSFERLPLVQDKALLDNILYSGVWVNYRSKRKEEDRNGRGSV